LIIGWNREFIYMMETVKLNQYIAKLLGYDKSL